MSDGEVRAGQLKFDHGRGILWLVQLQPAHSSSYVGNGRKLK